MSTDEKRDAEMDRLLRGVLKPAPQKPAGPCPEAQLLAAFVEGSLTASEQSVLDAHLANCSRCQEALAVLSHDLPHEEVVEPAKGWFTWVTQPRLRWLVPISAVATVTVIFFATRPLIAPAPQHTQPMTEVTQLAQAPPAPAQAPAADVETPREPSTAVPEAGSAGAVGTDRAAKSLPAKRMAEQPANELMAGAAPTGEALRDKKANEPADRVLAARVASEEKRETQAAPVPPPAAVAQPAAAQVVPAAPAEAERTVAPQAASKVAAVDETRKETAAEKARAVPVGAAGAVPAPAARALRLDAGPATVSGPGGVRWRLGAGGHISRSDDAGSTWREQRSGVTTDLLAGAAPSSTTCWIVGSAGTVLLTTDGEVWTRRPFPETVDLVAVSASSARAATVTTRDGRRFDTVDAGLSWSPKQQ